MLHEIDVVVVGAGPVGLLTAIELTLGGANVVVLERLESPSKAMKAMAIGPLGAEALIRRGMAAAIAAEKHAVRGHEVLHGASRSETTRVNSVVTSLDYRSSEVSAEGARTAYACCGSARDRSNADRTLALTRHRGTSGM